MLTEHRGKAMGTTVHIAAVGVTADDVAGFSVASPTAAGAGRASPPTPNSQP